MSRNRKELLSCALSNFTPPRLWSRAWRHSPNATSRAESGAELGIKDRRDASVFSLFLCHWKTSALVIQRDNAIKYVELLSAAKVERPTPRLREHGSCSP